VINNAQFATHMPVLVRAFDLSEGDILEVGTGYFSTWTLDWLCNIFNRKLISYETSPRWYNRFKKMQSAFHDIILVDSWDKVPFEEKHWGLAFIDCDPHASRATAIERLKDNADYIVAHDTEPSAEVSYDYPRIYPLFKYRFDYQKCEPWTSVFSNFHSLAKFKSNTK